MELAFNFKFTTHLLRYVMIFLIALAPKTIKMFLEVDVTSRTRLFSDTILVMTPRKSQSFLFVSECILKKNSNKSAGYRNTVRYLYTKKRKQPLDLILCNFPMYHIKQDFEPRSQSSLHKIHGMYIVHSK